jgi:hypothetical protein
MFRVLTITLGVAFIWAVPVSGQESGSQNKNVDIQTPSADLHVGNDADAKKAGLPLYPGARLRIAGGNNDQANLSVLTEGFGMKLIVAHYDSDGAPDKVIRFYRDKLKRYGTVRECHSDKQGSGIDVHDENDNSSNQLKCDQNSGPVTELKVGTENNQHIVVIEPGDAGKGSSFALVYLHKRGKEGEI